MAGKKRPEWTKEQRKKKGHPVNYVKGKHVIKCPMCEFWGVNLHPHIYFVHGMRSPEFKKYYPDTPMTSPFYALQRSKAWMVQMEPRKRAIAILKYLQVFIQYDGMDFDEATDREINRIEEHLFFRYKDIDEEGRKILNKALQLGKNYPSELPGSDLKIPTFLKSKVPKQWVGHTIREVETGELYKVNGIDYLYVLIENIDTGEKRRVQYRQIRRYFREIREDKYAR